MDPQRFIAETTPAAVPGLSGYSNGFRAMPGLIGWWTIEPVFTGAAANERITRVQPRVGDVDLIAPSPSIGPVARAWVSVMGSKFTVGAAEFLQPEVDLSATSTAVAMLVYSDGLGEAPIRTPFGWFRPANRSVRISRANNVWTAGTLTDPVPLAGGATYQLVIAEMIAGEIRLRIRDHQSTHAPVAAAYDGAGQLQGPDCRLIVGNNVTGTFNNSWDDGISETWLFDSSILDNPARLNAIDTYVSEVYYGG